MKKITITFLFLLLVIFSCQLKEDTTGTEENGTDSTTPIIIVAPNGGESISEGSVFLIKWTGTGTTPVRIQFSADNGSSWNLVADSLSNTGSHNWYPIPNSISSQCRIRISTLDGKKTDDSDLNFSIVKNMNQSLAIVSPIGKESWEAGTQQEIVWYSSGIDSVKLDYTTDNGNHWYPIGVDKKNTGIYYWYPIPNTTSSLAKVRITDAKDGDPSVQSPNTFNIQPEAKITVLLPNGNDTWISGSNKEIKWSSENIADVKIEYTTNAGGTWNTIVNSTPSTGTYMWNNIPSANNSLQCRIRISKANSTLPFDLSNDNFAIMDPGAQKLKIVSPNGGEKWNVGSMQNIIWDAGGIANVKLEYTVNNGYNWSTITSSTPSNGYFTWDPVPNTLGTNCKIRISDAQDEDPSDLSDNFFSILPAPSIRVVSPNGGETMQSGSNTEIQWVSENVLNVKIEYTTNGGAIWNLIVNSTESNGSYTWINVPNVNSLLCKVRVSDASNGASSDISDKNFTITNAVNKSLKVISPNGGEDWEAGTKQNITWNSTNVNLVKVELTTNKGSSWNTLVNNYSGGAYEWNVAENLNSTQCQIRITDVTDINLSDISDAVFIISPKKWLTVTGPLTKVYKSSEPVTISWQSGGIKYVGIKYTSTNGIADAFNPAFTVLADKVGATSGSYTTYFSRPSDQYFVVVYNADDGANEAPSNNSPGFTIEKSAAVSIQVLSPNGSEQWLASKKGALVTDIEKYHPFEIRWNATNVKKVKIEWSTTGGGSWYVVPGADSTANDGIYVWAPGWEDSKPSSVTGGLARPDSSDNCKIRISSADGNTQVSDETDGFFSIHESKKIRIEFPNDGEYFYPPNSLPPTTSLNWPMAIRWTSYAISGNVDLYYSLQNGANNTWIKITPNGGYHSTGLYAWDFTWGTLYGFLGPIETSWSSLGRIKIVDSADGKVWDVNDRPFYLNVKKD